MMKLILWVFLPVIVVQMITKALELPLLSMFFTIGLLPAYLIVIDLVKFGSINRVFMTFIMIIAIALSTLMGRVTWIGNVEGHNHGEATVRMILQVEFVIGSFVVLLPSIFALAQRLFRGRTAGPILKK